MSRLEAISELLGVTQDEARQFTKQVRSRFDAAPSYAEIIYAVRHHRGGKPSVDKVVAAIKRYHAGGGRASGGRGRRPPRRDENRPSRRGSRAQRGPGRPSRLGSRKRG